MYAIYKKYFIQSGFVLKLRIFFKGKQKFGNTIDSAVHLCSGEKNANKDTCQVKKHSF
jgi:hypothetical protein